MPELSPADIWVRCLQSIKPKVQEQSFRTWFEVTRCSHLCSEKAVIDVPSPFFAEWLEEHYAWLIQSTLEEITSSRPALTFSVQGNSRSKAEPPTGPVPFSGTSEAQRPPTPARPQSSSLNPRYRFDRFVVSPSTELPFSAARAVAENSGQECYNPLVLYGGVGLGKTHLLQAIGEMCLAGDASQRVVYTTAESFFADYIRGIRNRDTSEFVALYRNADVLLIDDIQFYVLTEGSQRELLHTFNALYQRGKQIVLTSDCPPAMLKGFVERLVSRFQSGLVAEVLPPDLDTRCRILMRKAADIQLDLSEDIACLIANEVTTNIRELEGALNRLGAYSRLTNQPVSLDLAHQTLQNGIHNARPSQSNTPTLASILTIAAKYFSVSEDSLTGPSRRQAVTQARHISMYLCKSLTDAPLKAIGKSFGGRDHSTVIHACRNIAKRAAGDASFKEQLGELKRRIGNNV